MNFIKSISRREVYTMGVACSFLLLLLTLYGHSLMIPPYLYPVSVIIAGNIIQIYLAVLYIYSCSYAATKYKQPLIIYNRITVFNNTP